MKGSIRNTLWVALAGTVLATSGCATYRGEYAYAEPAGYDYYYYDRGWYDGPNWYYYDRLHHLHHEDRAFRERRDGWLRDHARSAAYHERGDHGAAVHAGHEPAAHGTSAGGGHR